MAATEDLPSVTFLGHSTVRLDVGGHRILTDPLLRARVTFLARQVAPLPTAVYEGADLVLISHLHHDHCDLPSLRRLGADTTILVPVGAGAWLRGKGFRDVRELGAGEVHVDGRLRVRAVTALHHGRREPFGPHAEAIGFVINFDEACVYFAGDTDIYPGMAHLASEVDVALLPVWGWGPNLGPGHLDPHRAAQAAGLVGARFAVPVHWGTFYPFALRHALPSRLYDPPRAFRTAVEDLGVPVTVLHTPPGEPVTFVP